jgi:hypothetical protein
VAGGPAPVLAPVTYPPACGYPLPKPHHPKEVGPEGILSPSPGFGRGGGRQGKGPGVRSGVGGAAPPPDIQRRVRLMRAGTHAVRPYREPPSPRHDARQTEDA